VGPRVLVDATAVPADRGGVGRYVDGLIAALGVRIREMAPEESGHAGNEHLHCKCPWFVSTPRYAGAPRGLF